MRAMERRDEVKLNSSSTSYTGRSIFIVLQEVMREIHHTCSRMSDIWVALVIAIVDSRQVNSRPYVSMFTVAESDVRADCLAERRV